MSDSRNVQLLRILGMIRDLSAARTGVSIQDLRDRYGVTRRTIERDLAAIEEAGYVVETLSTLEPGKVRKRVLAGSSGLHLPVTAEELAAAHAGVSALEREAPVTVAAALRMLVNRLEENQSLAVGVDAEVLADAQDFVPRPRTLPSANPVFLDAIHSAILQCERLRISYRKGGVEPPRDYVAEPYGLLYGEKSYLVWRGVEDGKWRLFALPYMERVEPTSETFTRDPGFVLSNFAAESFGIFRETPFHVVLRILPSGMTRLRHHSFHPTQSVEPLEDGGAVVRFTASGLTEICWHLFSWGGQLRILAPKELAAVYVAQLDEARKALDVTEESQETGRPPR